MPAPVSSAWSIAERLSNPSRVGYPPPIIIDTTVKNNISHGSCQQFIAGCLRKGLPKLSSQGDPACCCHDLDHWLPFMG
jgi:hypothetical protein